MFTYRNKKMQNNQYNNNSRIKQINVYIYSTMQTDKNNNNSSIYQVIVHIYTINAKQASTTIIQESIK